MNKIYHNPFGWSGDEEDAIYHEQILPMYQDNPLIEALPPIRPSVEVFRNLTKFPPMKSEYRLFPAEERLHLIRCIDQFFQPLPRHGRLFSDICGMIYKGYIARNPLSKGFWKTLDGNVDKLVVNLRQKNHIAYRKSATTMSLIGISGIGKSRSLEEVLSLFPQIINHHTYRGVPFPWKQLVWLKLECPHNGLTRSLGLAFFEQIDWILGTNYMHGYARNGRATEMELLKNMARVGAIHSLGVLVIDEIQALSQAKSGGAEEMLNFFVELVNTLGLPIILIGTYKAQKLFSQAFRQARRANSYGGDSWDRMKVDEDWKLFLETLWQFQYTKHPVKLTDRLAETLYDLSQGITDIAIKVFILGQTLAIRTGEERLSPELLITASERALSMVQPFLTALRTNNMDQFMLMEDIQPINLEIALNDLNSIYTNQQSLEPHLDSNESLSKRALGIDLAIDSSSVDAYDQLKQQNLISDISSDLSFLSRNGKEESNEASTEKEESEK